MSLSCQKAYSITVTQVITLSSSQNPTVSRKTVTLTGVTVLGGTMSFFKNGVLLGTAAITAGVATFAWNTGTADSGTTVALTAKVGTATSNTVNQVVDPLHLQIDLNTVAIINGYATFFGWPVGFTGLLALYAPGAWFEDQPGTSSLGGWSITETTFPVLDIVVSNASGSSTITIGAAAVNGFPTGATTLPTGSWNASSSCPGGYFPCAFSPSNPPSWPPNTMNPITITFA